mmetsp:Transcript_26417/g.47644  ORF Transcript_26417/g.47644 Transcript_26417/m.47644 type:complete len:238 (-) Transcript_26417:130-843(-)
MGFLQKLILVSILFAVPCVAASQQCSEEPAVSSARLLQLDAKHAAQEAKMSDKASEKKSTKAAREVSNTTSTSDGCTQVGTGGALICQECLSGSVVYLDMYYDYENGEELTCTKYATQNGKAYACKDAGSDLCVARNSCTVAPDTSGTIWQMWSCPTTATTTTTTTVWYQYGSEYQKCNGCNSGSSESKSSWSACQESAEAAGANIFSWREASLCCIVDECTLKDSGTQNWTTWKRD